MLHKCTTSTLGVLLLLLCATVNYMAVGQTLPNYTCVHMTGDVLDPTSQYYTGVRISGVNKCPLTLNLNKCAIEYSTNYAAGTVWGSALLSSTISPTFKNNTARLYLGGSSSQWSQPVSCLVIYVINLKGT